MRFYFYKSLSRLLCALLLWVLTTSQHTVDKCQLQKACQATAHITAIVNSSGMSGN